MGGGGSHGLRPLCVFDGTTLKERDGIVVASSPR
jgi:hypothetical protein